MTDFLNSIFTVSWWISVVIGGILINILSHYLQKSLDKQLYSMSLWWRFRSDAQKAQRNKIMDVLRNNHNERVNYFFQEIRYLLFSILFMLFSMLFIALTILIGTDIPIKSTDFSVKIVISITGLLASISVIMGLIAFWLAGNLRNLQFDSYKIVK